MPGWGLMEMGLAFSGPPAPKSLLCWRSTIQKGRLRGGILCELSAAARVRAGKNMDRAGLPGTDRSEFGPATWKPKSEPPQFFHLSFSIVLQSWEGPILQCPTLELDNRSRLIRQVRDSLSLGASIRCCGIWVSTGDSDRFAS